MVLDLEMSKQLLREHDEFVVFDLETTGLSPDKFAEILEIGAIRIIISDGKAYITEKFSEFIKPLRGTVPPKITEHTSITTEMVSDARYFEDVLPEFAKFIEGCVLVAHNARFDVSFLEAYFPRIGVRFQNDCIDTMTLDKELHPERAKHNLAIITESYGITNKNAHRAISDAMATAKVLNYYRKELLEMPNEGGFHVYHEQPPEGYADLSSMKIMRMSPYQYKDKKLGKAVFFNTNFGTFYFNLKRGVWGRQTPLKVFSGNVNMKEVRDTLVNLSGMDEKKLIGKFGKAG